jgi:hypothetical protein
MRINGCTLLTLVSILSFGITGCSNATQPAPLANTAADSSNPADGNLAPTDNSAPPRATAQQNPQQQPYTAPQSQASYNPPPPPPSYSAPETGYASVQQSDSGSYDAYDSQEDETSGQQVIQADQPPPPLPEYSQPPCPGENYIWTPGYWSYSASDYYWVPGVWVTAPYVGALWTPPYWGYYQNHYRWHRGFWGTHIGFYGGINYGFGYVGRGYYGGYWRDGAFAYNRTVNNINVNVVKNVYNYRVTNTVTNSRVSYNGGRGGIEVRPTAPELAVLHEQRMAPVAAQVQLARQSEANRAQFANVNRGRPAEAALAHPLQTEYHAPAPRPSEVAGHPRVIAPLARPAEPRPETRAQAVPQPAGRPEPGRAPQEPGKQFGAARPQPGREQARPMEAQRPQPAPRMEAQQHPQPAPPQARPMEAQRPQPAPRMEVQHPQPAPHAEAPRPQPMQAPRPQPAPHAEAPRPQPMQAPRPQPAARAEAPRPQPAPRMEAPRPQPAPRAEPPHPAPQQHAPAPHPEEKHPGR